MSGKAPRAREAPGEARADEARYPDIPVGPRLEALLSLAYRARRPVLLEGPTGVGKSEIVRGLARKLGIGTVVLDLSLLEPPDLVGLPVIEGGRTAFALPKVLPSEGAGILMLEELNRAERYIQQPSLQLLSARRLHDYELPPDWVCFAAINPETGDYHVTPLDRALRARFLCAGVRADRAAWLSWALESGVHPAVVDLVRSQARALDDVPPRTWAYASQIIAALGPGEARDEALQRDALGGYLPPAYCELLLAGRQGWPVGLGVDVRRVLAEYAPGSEVAKSLRALLASGRTDQVDELAFRVEQIVRGPEVALLAAEQRFSLAAFEALLADLPGDQRERLQEALGSNAVAASLLEVAPHELLSNFANGPADRLLRGWLADPLKHHRVALLVRALRAHLEGHPKLAELRRQNTVRASLGALLARLGEGFAMPLVEALLKLSIAPIRPPS
ncbi:MAG TPA: MoxR family ATPase [Polyangiaceae bacterium]|nr:MoxR family ATPase [Polyangiaceae bacterium]